MVLVRPRNISRGMDSNLVSAMAALVGAVIGGLTSVATSWLAQRVQARAQWRRQEHQRREDLYRAFIEDAALCYADALQHDEPQMSVFVGIYAKIDQMRVRSSDRVIASALEIRRRIVETYLDTNKAFPELRDMLADGSIDLLGAFSEACRAELEKMRAERG